MSLHVLYTFINHYHLFELFVQSMYPPTMSCVDGQTPPISVALNLLEPAASRHLTTSWTPSDTTRQGTAG